MEQIVKARKIYTCEMCLGNIQKGEKHKHVKTRLPDYDNEDNQIGVTYYKYRQHNRECRAKLLYYINPDKAIKNCTKGVHSLVSQGGPDDDGTEWCEWCGIVL